MTENKVNMQELLVIIQFFHRNVVTNDGVVGLAGPEMNTLRRQHYDWTNKMVIIIYMCIYMYICVCMYIFIYTYIYICVCVCTTYLYIYIYACVCTIFDMICHAWCMMMYVCCMICDIWCMIIWVCIYKCQYIEVLILYIMYDDVLCML